MSRHFLKQEIARVSRKELRARTDSLKRTLLKQRTAIASMRRRLDALERQLERVQKSARRTRDADDVASPKLRFRSAGFKKHRERLGLSAARVGKILGVSQLSVYNWENGKTKPQAKQFLAIAQLRKMGKRDANRRLSAALSQT